MNDLHPYQINICGFSGSGKTTLISKLAPRLSQLGHWAFVKSDAHQFSMDKPGKDTFVIKESGANGVYILSKNGQAHLSYLEPIWMEEQSALRKYDFVVVEGRKNKPHHKIVLIDSEEKILSEPLENVIAYVGAGIRPSGLQGDRPYFQRDEIDKIFSFVKSELWQQIPPLNGLVLAGGKSQRMKQDKALLTYHGVPEVVRVYNLIEELLGSCFVSVKADDKRDCLVGKRKVFDVIEDLGPIGGLISCFLQNPNKAIVAFGCDMPRVNSNTLQQLFSRRNPFKFATTMMGSQGLPEPLATIYEPKILPMMLNAISGPSRCPRKILCNIPIEKVFPLQSIELENFNTPEDYVNFNGAML